MDDSARPQPAATPTPAQSQTPKQQISELLRGASNVLVTTTTTPSLDDYASAIALTQILEKLGKQAEAVISKNVPKELAFLPTELVKNKFTGLRDFVIELDVSKTEADKLKYVPEGKRLKIYITPYNGNFTKDDLGFSYGDYHCDAVIVLGGTKPEQIDGAIASQKQLLSKTKLVYIKPGQAEAASGGLSWNEPTATSISEMLMSLTESLQPGLLDNHIATSLLTGIVAVTDHFTAANTTPKVMTMAAQLMAAGANQADIVKHLQTPAGKNSPKLKEAKEPPKADGKAHELQASGEQELPHQLAPQPLPVPPPVVPVAPQTTPPPMPQPQQPTPMSPMPPRSPLISGVRTEHEGNAFATVSGSPLNTPPSTASPVVNSTPANSSLVGNEHKPIDIDAARRAVEEAANHPVPAPVLPPQAPPPQVAPPATPPQMPPTAPNS